MADGSSKFKNSINLEPQSADPSNPAEGDIFCSDGTSRAAGYWQYINGAWSEFGGGGQGGINYLAGDNSDAENGIGDWVTYADAAGENAVDGTGGTALGVTLTQNTTDPLRETADFKFSKDAADRQGEGASCAFTIDNADKAQKLTISFDYDASSANYADDDIRIAIYDVTNSNLIRVNGEDLKGGKGTHLAQFQTAADSTSYRLIIHQSSTNATAYDVYLDNISVGPREVVKGAAMTDWIDYTPTITNGAGSITATLDGKYKRVGDSLEIILKYNYTSGTGAAAEFRISLPTGLSVDTNKAPNGSVLGSGYWFTNANGFKNTDVRVSSNSLIFTKDSVTALLQGTDVDDAGSAIAVSVKVPIQGWSSNAVTSEDLGGREIITEIEKTTAQSIPNNSSTLVTFDATAVVDTVAAYDGVDEIEIVESGYYDVVGSSSWAAATTSFARTQIYYVPVGGTATLLKETNYAFNDNGSTGSIFEVNLTAHYFQKGEKIRLYVRQFSGGGAIDLIGADLTVAKRSSPQTILETETVAARYTSNNGQSVTTASTYIAYENLVRDTHNAYNTSSGEYTVPVSGWYDMTARMGDSGTSHTFINIGFEVDGSIVDQTQLVFANAEDFRVIEVNSRIYLEKNQIVKVIGDVSTNINLSSLSYRNTFSIAKIK